MDEKSDSRCQRDFFLLPSFRRGGETRRPLSSSSSDDHLDEAFGFDKSVTMTPRVHSDSRPPSELQLDFSGLPASTLSFLDEDEGEPPRPTALSQTLKAKVERVFAQVAHPCRRQNSSQLSTSESLQPPLRFGQIQSNSQTFEPSPFESSRVLLSKLEEERPTPPLRFSQTETAFYGSKKLDKPRANNRRTNRVNTQDYSIDASLMSVKRKTTLQIANIPNKYTKNMLMQFIDEEFSGKYDFFYLPIDFQNTCNMGYAFINFVDVESAKKFYLTFHKSKWPRFQSDKICEVRYAVLQGQEANIKFFENSQLIRQADAKFKPFIKS